MKLPALLLLCLLSLAGCQPSDPQWEAVLTAQSDVDASATELRSVLQTIPAQEQVGPAYVRLAGVLGISDQENAGIGSLGGLSVEDLVMLVFMELSQDAENDMRQLLDEMAATAADKKALRDAAQKMKDAQAALRQSLAAEYGKLTADGAVAVDATFEQYLTFASLGKSGTIPAAAGTVSASVSCGETAGAITLVLRSLLDDTILATATGSAGSAKESMHNAGLVPVRAEISVASGGLTTCRLAWHYPARPRGPAIALTDAQRRANADTTVLLNQSRQGLLDELAKLKQAQTPDFDVVAELALRLRANTDFFASTLAAGNIDENTQRQLEAMADSNFMLLMIQTKVQNVSQNYQTLSNLLKADSDAKLNAVRNMRS